jgi:hypothetical protein
MEERDDVGASARPESWSGSETARDEANPPGYGWGKPIAEPVNWTSATAATHATEPSAVKQLASQAREGTVRLASQASEQVGQVVSQRKDETAERLTHLAGALRDAARALAERDAAGFGRYADVAAQQVDRVSGYLRERDLGAVARDARQLARRHPELFLAGSFVAGLALARFLKSSAQRAGGGV